MKQSYQRIILLFPNWYYLSSEAYLTDTYTDNQLNAIPFVFNSQFHL